MGSRGDGAAWPTSLLLQIFVVPGDIPLQTVALVTGALDAVRFVGVDNQLRIDPQALQRLVHLLSTLHRHVEIALTAQKQGGRLDAVGVQERQSTRLNSS